MIKNEKVRTGIWVDARLVLLLNERGLTLTSFVRRALPIFLDLPEDPREKLIQEKMNAVVLRLRSTYAEEIKEKVRQSVIESQADLQLDDHTIELMDLGDLLQNLKIYNLIEQDLKTKNFGEDDSSETLWEDVTAIVNAKTGKNYSWVDIWNKSLEWYKDYGKTRSKN